jgi:hypothetical protein
LLAQAVEAEVAALVAGHADKLTNGGHQQLVRHGYLPEREIMTGIGPGRRICVLYYLKPRLAYRRCNSLWYAAQRKSSFGRKALAKRKNPPQAWRPWAIVGR